MPPALPGVADSRSRQSYLPRKVRLIVNRALVQHLSKGQSKRYGINRLGLIPLTRGCLRAYHVAGTEVTIDRQHEPCAGNVSLSSQYGVPSILYAQCVYLPYLTPADFRGFSSS